VLSNTFNIHVPMVTVRNCRTPHFMFGILPGNGLHRL